MRIAIYTRKSKETDTGESIKNQINMCKEYFNRQYSNCTFEIFEDEGFSGGNTNRPSFQRMMQLAKSRQFDIIAAYRLDRISRNTLDFLMMFEELKEYDIQLVSVTEGFDASTPAGKMMMSMVSSMAEMERMNIAQRVKDNMKELAKMGRWSGGTPPTGYKSITLDGPGGKKETYLELIPEQELKIKKIFQKAIEGYTTFQIGKELNISPKTVYNIITNPVYVSSSSKIQAYLEQLGYTVYGENNNCGYLPYNRRPKKGSKKLFNSIGMFTSVSTHKAIVSDFEWIQANNNLKARGTEQKPRISSYSFLAHLVKCSCNKTMYIHIGNKKADGTRITYFRCSGQKTKTVDCNAKWLKVKDVEDAFIDTITSISLDKKTLEQYLASKIKKIDYEKLIKQTKKDISKKHQDINSLTEKLILITGPAIEIITKKINQISQEIESLNTDLLTLERKQIFQEQDTLNINTLHKQITDTLKDFNSLTMEDKQIAAQKILKEVKYNGLDEVDFIL